MLYIVFQIKSGLPIESNVTCMCLQLSVECGTQSVEIELCSQLRAMSDNVVCVECQKRKVNCGQNGALKL